MFELFYFLYLFAMFIQGAINIYLSLYIWESPERLEAIALPKEIRKPKRGFTVLLPARHEDTVIGHTIKKLASVNYPKELVELLVICEENDTDTILEAKRSIAENYITNARVITFNDYPVNKPHGLNKGLWLASHDTVTVFDAEDDVSPELFNSINTLFVKDNPDVIQAGVQLINYDSRWFSAHNVLEYYFWFKSRMHFHTKLGVVPLGGNTVFIKTDMLKKMGGWDENCLTEDAELGIRLSTNGAKILAVYDPEYVTKEETPHTVGQFIKQRTRWNQGFIQVLRLGIWRQYDSAFQRVFCVYTLAFPLVQTVLFTLTPVVFVFGILEKLPVGLALLSFLPVVLIVVQYTTSAVGMHEFIHEQKLHNNRMIYLWMLLSFLPYQMLLGIGALRATYREIRGVNNWEKTAHAGMHREMYTSFMPDTDIAL